MIPKYDTIIKYGIITMEELNNYSGIANKGVWTIAINKIFKHIPLKARLYCLYIILYCMIVCMPIMFLCFVISLVCYPFYKIYDYIDKKIL